MSLRGARRDFPGVAWAVFGLLVCATGCDRWLTSPVRYHSVSVSVATRPGSPVPGVQVHLYTGRRFMSYATTDASGRFTFTMIPDGSYGVYLTDLPKGYHTYDASNAGAGGAIIDGLPVGPSSSPSANFKVLLEGPGSVSVRVTRPDSTPIAAVPTTISDQSGKSRSGMTDNTGLVVFPDLPFGVYYAHVPNPELCDVPGARPFVEGGPVPVDSGARESIVFRIVPCVGSVKVVVNDNNVGVPHFPVVLYTSLGVIQQATTDFTGAHTFGPVQCGEYGVSIRPKAGYSYTDALGLAYNSVIIRRTVLPVFTYRVVSCLGSISVRVLGENGLGVAGFPLRLYTPTAILQEPVTDAAGSYLFTELPCGEYDVAIRPNAGYTYVDSIGQAYDHLTVTNNSRSSFTYHVKP